MNWAISYWAQGEELDKDIHSLKYTIPIVRCIKGVVYTLKEEYSEKEYSKVYFLQYMHNYIQTILAIKK